MVYNKVAVLFLLLKEFSSDLHVFSNLLERLAISSSFYPNFAVLPSVFEAEITCYKENQRQKIGKISSLIHFISVILFY